MFPAVEEKKTCLKRSEGGQKPTERSVFKFFFHVDCWLFLGFLVGTYQKEKNNYNFDATKSTFILG